MGRHSPTHNISLRSASLKLGKIVIRSEEEDVTRNFARWLLLIGFASVGCQPHREFPASYTVYQVVLADLLETVNGKGDFNGKQLAASPSQCDGTSNGFGCSLTVDQALLLDLEKANKEKQEFEPKEFTLEGVRVEEIPAFGGMYYHRDGNQPQNLKCLVQFWRVGFSKDNKTAVVKFRYGPSSHGAIGTYVLQRTTKHWKIVKSTIDYYV